MAIEDERIIGRGGELLVVFITASVPHRWDKGRQDILGVECIRGIDILIRLKYISNGTLTDI